MTIITRAVNHRRSSTGHYVRRLKQAPNSSRRQARCPDGSTFKFISKDNSYIVKAKRREDNSNQRWKGSLHFSAMRHNKIVTPCVEYRAMKTSRDMRLCEQKEDQNQELNTISSSHLRTCFLFHTGPATALK